jgi:VWFA-related protein
MLGRAILFVAAAGTAATALQTPPQTFRAGVDVVQVDVTVLDKERRPVRGLTASDFTILEDGKPRPVVAFVPVDIAERESVEGRASWVRDVAPDVADNNVRPEGRLVVIMFDWSIRFGDQTLAKRIATAAVDQLGPNDLAAVVFTNASAGSGAPQNFTADRGRLLAAINRPFAVALHNPPNGPSHDPRNANLVMIDDPEGYESGECACRRCVADTIARVADAVRDVPGRRKTLLFIGTYFRLSEGLQGPLNKAPPAAPAAITGLIPVNPNIMACAQPLRDAREAMLRATAAANLTIHTIDPVGIETPMNSPLGGSDEGIRVRQDDLTSLADLTGGRAIMHTEAPETKIPALFGESQSYYLLAFAPSDSKADGKFHKLSVKVNRADVTVRTRSGYYAGGKRGDERAASAISPDTANAIEGVLPRTDLPLSVAAAPFALPGGTESAVAVVLGVRQPQPSERDAKNPVKVLAAAFDRNGRSVQSETRTIAVTWKADASGSMPYELLSRLTLKPGRYELRLAIDASLNQRASVYTYVDVPDFSQQPLSLSGIVLGAATGPLSAPKDAFATLLPIVPTARRTFDAADRVTAFVRVYEASKKPAIPAAVITRILDANDGVAFNDTVTIAADRFRDTHAADHRIELPLSTLARGQYLLTMETTAGEYAARRGVRFTVQ